MSKEKISEKEVMEETPVQEETVVKEKKGCTRKENKKDKTKIEELEAQVAELHRLIIEGGLTGEKIAERIGCSTATVVWHRDRLRLNDLLNERAK